MSVFFCLIQFLQAILHPSSHHLVLVLDSSGKMIGMATAIYSPSGASAGVGFAIPADTVKYVASMLIKNGQIIRPLLGVSILDSKQARQALGITKGILILEVKPGENDVYTVSF